MREEGFSVSVQIITFCVDKPTSLHNDLVLKDVFDSEVSNSTSKMTDASTQPGFFVSPNFTKGSKITTFGGVTPTTKHVLGFREQTLKVNNQ